MPTIARHVVAALSAVLIVLCALVAGPTRSSAADELTFGVDPTYRPLAFYDENKTLVGFDIDLAREMAKRMGATPKWETMSFDGLIPALQAKRIDIEAELSVRPQRKEQVDFSTPFFSQSLTPVVQASRQNFSPKDLNDLKPDRIGVTSGTSADLLFANQQGFNLTRYNTTLDAFRDLILNRIDVVVVDSLTAGYQVKNTFPGQLRVAKIALSTRTDVASAVRKGNSELLARLNKAIETMKSDGSLDAIVKKWFGDIEY
jgi:ABC-type amino acid transport substrate-binding protein